MFDVIRELLISGKEFSKTKYERLKKGFGLDKKQHDRLNLYLTFGSLIKINNIITDSNNITLGKLCNALWI